MNYWLAWTAAGIFYITQDFIPRLYRNESVPWQHVFAGWMAAMYICAAFTPAMLWLGRYVRLHAGQSTYLLHVPISTIETSLDPECFVRIHRSHIVNMKRIKQLWSLAHGQYAVELASGERIQSGRTYGERIRSFLSNPF